MYTYIYHDACGLMTAQVIRSDGLIIPICEGNTDYENYLLWVAAGNTAPVVPCSNGS